MIDISKINGELISKLAGAYLHATFVFGMDPVEASEAKQRRIRKWISNQYRELVHELPENVDIFSTENRDQDLLLLLKSCLTLQKALAEEKEKKFELDFASLDALSKTALKHLLEISFWPETTLVGEDLKIITDDTPAFRRILTLENTDAVPMGKAGSCCQNLEMVLKKEQNRYCFYGELEDPLEESEETFALTFENAHAEIEVYNACKNMTFWENPWNFLRSISFAICTKAELPGDYCNPRERALLPVLKEIVALAYWIDLPEQDLFSFRELKKAAHSYGYHKAERLLSKLETIKPGDAAFYKSVKKLVAILCEKQCAPLWREVFTKLTDSQAEYPNKTDALCDKELLGNVRNDIQALMVSNGYMGTYPDFIKVGALNGVHLAHAYNMTYFVGMEKRAAYHIHCCESFEANECLTVQFLCSTAFLKKGEEADLYDCLFHAKGRRLFHIVHHDIPLQAKGGECADSLETAVTIAVKKAECVKLNKAEQKAFYGQALPGWGLFWQIFLIAGGMFGIAMTLFAMVICIIITAASGLLSDVPEMLSQMPWGHILAIGWIGFGGAMGIVEVLARRR